MISCIPQITSILYIFSLEHAKEHVAQNPTRLISFHNQLATQERTLINDPTLIIKC